MEGKTVFKYLFILGLILWVVDDIDAQNKSASFVIGIEAGGRSNPLFSKEGDIDFGNRKSTVGLIIEVPFKGKFSFGTGFVYSKYGAVNTFEKSGLTKLNAEDDIEYEILKSGLILSYFAVPVRMIYRLKCNCVYAQLGIQPEFYFSGLNNSNHTSFYTKNPDSYPDYTINTINKPNWTLDFGIGFKAHFRENIRLIFRPSYNKILNPIFKNHPISSRNYLRMVFGVQYAFLKRK